MIASSFLFPAALFSNQSSNDAMIKRRVEAHLLLRDYRSAYEEVQRGIAKYPESRLLQESRIQVLARVGDEKAMYSAWQEYASQYEGAFKNRDILEVMAWGIIEKGNASQSPITRAVALLSAFFSNSAQGVAMLHENMENSNSFIRGVSVQLAGHLHDTKLLHDVLRVFRNEKVWSVHLEAVKAIGSMKIHEAREELKEIVANEKTPAEEKAAAIESLVHLVETISRDELASLATSKRSGLRLLACQAAAELDLIQDLDLIIPLVNDHCPEVRETALIALGVLRTEEFKGVRIAQIAQDRINDPDQKVAITAAWLLTLHDSEEGKKAFTKWLNHTSPDARAFSASALSATGKHGFPLVRQFFYQTRDPYVKMNLAFGLLSQRVDTEIACEALYQGLMHLKDKFMWEERGIFRILVPSTVKHKEEIPQYPEVVNQLVRLEMIQVLAFMHHPHAQTAMKAFLKERIFGVTGIAVALLLTEGDEEALDLVRGLLQDEDVQIRAQAALILALWGRDEEAISHLQNGYVAADRELQEKILEGLGRIGSESSIPFLVEKLNEPYQNLRLMAASALLQSLYH